LLAPPAVGQHDHAVSYGSDLPLYLPYVVRQLDLVRPELGGPPFEPVVHHFTAKPPFFPGVWIEASQMSPDRLGLVEHGVLNVGVGAGAGETLTQRLEGSALQRVAADRFDPNQERGERHEQKAEQEPALKGHGEARSMKRTASVRLPASPGPTGAEEEQERKCCREAYPH